ncbi:hypothetical protein D3C84_931950 [compost metagenome]
MQRSLRMEKLKAMAVLKATVLRVAISREGSNCAADSAQAWARPQPSEVQRIRRQCWSSHSCRQALLACGAGRCSQRRASIRAKKPDASRPLLSMPPGLLPNSQVSSQASR